MFPAILKIPVHALKSSCIKQMMQLSECASGCCPVHFSWIIVSPILKNVDISFGFKVKHEVPEDAKRTNGNPSRTGREGVGGG